MSVKVSYQAIWEKFREKHARATADLMDVYELPDWVPVNWLRHRDWKKFYNFKKCVKAVEKWTDQIYPAKPTDRGIKRLCKRLCDPKHYTYVKQKNLEELGYLELKVQ